jgi:RNA polymerase sigma factor (sigma-70 family)
MSTNDIALLDRWCRNRDAEAFRELVERHAALVFATARRILGDASAAEDVAQECFLRLAESRAPSNLPAWLHRVAVNRALDLARSERRRREHEAGWKPPERRPSDPGWQEIEGLVDRAIEDLPEEMRVPVVLHFLEGRTLEDTAERIGIGKSTTSDRLEKGIEGIRKSLARRGVRTAPALLAGWLASRASASAPPTLIARLGKLALAGPEAATAAGALSGRAVPALVSAARNLLILGGVMKLYVAIGAALIVLAAILALSLSPPAPKPPEAAGAAGALPKVAAAPPAEATPAAPPKTEKRAEAPAPPEPAATASLSGTVTDADGTPIPFAEVLVAVHPELSKEDGLLNRLEKDVLRSSSTFGAKTDSQGRYRLEGLPAGQTNACAFHEGRAAGASWTTLRKGAAAELNLKLDEGRTLRGIVLGPDGKAATGAVVSIYQAWHPRDMVFGGGMGITDGAGRFRLALGRKDEKCDLRVNSESLGQDFFFEVPVGTEEVRLEWHERAAVRGTITWRDGSPAQGVRVCVSASIRDPDNAGYLREGFRPMITIDGPVAADGTYEIGGLQPGLLDYDIFVIAAGGERRKRILTPLTPRWKERFRLAPGETKEWNAAIGKPTVVTGTVRTEIKGTPVPLMNIGVRKDGKEIEVGRDETNEKGAFRLSINTGPGRYLVYPNIQFGSSSALLAERFGKTIDLEGGEEVEANLQVFEPVVLKFRVRDASGKPVTSIDYELSIRDTGGQRYGLSSSMPLDAEGRGSLPFHVPITEGRLQVRANPGPMFEVRRFSANPGTIFEDDVVLPRTCDLSGIAVDGEGSPLGECGLTIEAAYEDGEAARPHTFGLKTDRKGAFSGKGYLRASPLTLTIRADGHEGIWKSGKLDASALETLDLGPVAIAAKKDD